MMDRASNILLDLLKPNSTKSSSRAINIIGAIVATVLIILDTIMHSAVSPELFTIYLGYCSLNYGINRATQGTSNDQSTNNSKNGE